MRKINFLKLINKYDAIFFDSYGVIKNYYGLIPGAIETIDYLREQNKLFRILTNDASRSPAAQVQKFEKSGLKNLKEHEIVTSGMMAKQFIEGKLKGKTIAYLGTEDAANYALESAAKKVRVQEINEDHIEDISAMVFLDDEGYGWEDSLNKVVNLLRTKPIPVIVANSDKIYPTSRNNVHIATGGLALAIEEILGLEFIHFGKPDSNMFHYAYEDLFKEHKISKRKILMVGDTLHTDIMGGNKFGIDTALVFTGNTTPKTAKTLINTNNIVPDYICNSISIEQ